MTRATLLVAAALLLALGGVSGVLLLRSEPADGAGLARQLAAELRCPDCQALSVADSDTAAAIEIRRRIDELLAAGATPDEVRAHFVERYGEWILLAPRSPLPWALPFAALLAGGVALAAWLVLGRRFAAGRTDRSAQPAALDEEARRRIDEELEVLDA